LENNTKVEKFVVGIDKSTLVWTGTLVVLMARYRTFVLGKILVPEKHKSNVVFMATRNAMIEENIGLVVNKAQKFRRDDVPLKDLINYGKEGLIKAVDGYDRKKNFEFGTYAGTCIYRTIRCRLAKYESPIRLPEHQVIEKKIEKKAATKAYVKKGETSLFFDDVDPRVAYSLDNGMTGDDGDNLPPTSLVDARPTPEEVVLCRLKESYKKKATRLLGVELSPREWFILSCRFGIGTDEPATLEKIGSVLGISRNRVQVIEKISLAKARKKLAFNNLTAGCFF